MPSKSNTSHVVCLSDPLFYWYLHDDRSRLRESTLMSLIYVVDKLDETQLQDRLVRCVVNLQNDPEASIRTNATIFLGKIAAKLKESVRYVHCFN